MSRWYRAYEGTTTDAKLAEVASLAGVSRSVVIATWHALLESCAGTQDAGRFTITARRIAAALVEPADAIAKVFEGLAEVGMIQDDRALAWSRRQFESDNSTGRSRKHRQNKANVAANERNGDATLHDRSRTSPSVCVSASVSNEVNELPPEGEALPRARLDEIQAQLSEAAGDCAMALNLNISPIVRLLEAGWQLERDILPAVREIARTKRPSSWSYVARTLEGRAADLRAQGPPPGALPPANSSNGYANGQRKPTVSEVAFDIARQARERESLGHLPSVGRG